MIAAGFDPLAGTLGGLLIGGSAVLLMGTLGRIAGISGMVGGVLDGPVAERGWRWMFLAGLLAGALLYRFAWGGFPFEPSASLPLLVLAGLLVGIGTRLGSGCTSGHGVCGIARGRRRSMVATAMFMATAMLVVWTQRLLQGGA